MPVIHGSHTARLEPWIQFFFSLFLGFWFFGFGTRASPHYSFWTGFLRSPSHFGPTVRADTVVPFSSGAAVFVMWLWSSWRPREGVGKSMPNMFCWSHTLVQALRSNLRTVHANTYCEPDFTYRRQTCTYPMPLWLPTWYILRILSVSVLSHLWLRFYYFWFTVLFFQYISFKIL